MKIFISEDAQWIMEQQEMPIAKLADLTGWTASNLYSVIGGKRPITQKTADLIADALGVGVHSIVEYDVDPDEVPRLEDKKEALHEKIQWNDRKLEDATVKYNRLVREHARLSRKYETELAEIVDQLVFLKRGQK